MKEGREGEKVRGGRREEGGGRREEGGGREGVVGRKGEGEKEW